MKINPQHLQDLFSASPDGIVLLDEQGTIQHHNREFSQLCGRPESSLSGQPLDQFWQTGQADKLTLLLQQSQGARKTQLEVFAKAINGSSPRLELRASGLPLGGTQLHLVTIRDISARYALYRRNQQLVEEFRYQKQALDQHAIVSIHDQAGRFSYVNDNLCKLFGYSRDELLNNYQHTLRLSAASDHTEAEIWAAVSRQEIWQGELQVHTRAAEMRWLHTTIVPFVNDGRPNQQIAISTDITDRKLIELELQTERDFNASVLNALPNLVVVSELDGRIIHVNDACTRMSGFSHG